MKVRLLKKLRRKAYLRIGMLARIVGRGETRYCVGARKEIMLENWHKLIEYCSYEAAIYELHRLRRRDIREDLRNIRLDRQHKQLKKLNRKFKLL